MLRWPRRLLVSLVLLVLAAVLAGWGWLSLSLPTLDGERTVAGLRGPVGINRDALGTVRLEGGHRADLALALGFIHAQDRFFQMDLQRRSAAGELAALFGTPALDADRDTRVHRFRARAKRNLALATPGVRTLLEAYATGVNAGLADLGRPPFEYTVLRVAPEPWRAEDAYLTLFAMTLMLQDERGRVERGRGLLHEVLPPDLAAFFDPRGGRWDAPLTGEPLPEAPIPARGLADLPEAKAAVAYGAFDDGDLLPGSNNWAVSGDLTAHGGALVADDMHLPIRVPNIWYRAAWTDPRNGRTVGGVTLPGVPFLVAGSNGRVAWGFTNTQGDWTDVIQLETSEDGGRYRTPDGWAAFARFDEVIEVKGGDDHVERVRETRWGPVVGEDHHGRLLALRWTAHDPEGANFNITGMELADTVFEPLAGAHRFGIPHQNLVMGDRGGNIAWTIAGPVPRREGFDGRLPGPWHDGQRRWNGYLDGDAHPRIVNPPSGRLWTANARVVSGEAYAAMGSHGVALGARQGQIRDRLLALERADEADMLALQLDDEARFLDRWRTHLLALLDEAAVAGEPALAAARDHVEGGSGHAARDDVGYRLVRNFRLEVMSRVTAPVDAVLRDLDDDFRLRRVNRQLEYPTWALIEARPAHLLNPDFDSWRDLELDALRAVVQPLFDDGGLDDDTWGEANRLAIRHPLAGALPVLGRWLAMPDEPMSGDTHMPRVQAPRHGASERFAVSPGREGDAYLHMATGQSSHPLSPFFDAGHRDWVEGRPTPWLPGAPRHTLVLRPAAPPP